MTQEPSPDSASASRWDADRYEERHSFVWNLAAGVIDLLKPQPGERILDLGCGTGQLTERIAQSGAEVVGIDRDAAMIARAKEHYPSLHFDVADATRFHFSAPFDAIFSNAALHWVKPPEMAVACMAQALKPGGRLVAEFGGKGNIEKIETALGRALDESGHREWRERYPWYYPSIGTYASLLEAHGFRVTSAALFDRPTELEGEDAMENWVRMFGQSFLQSLPEGEWPGIFRRVEELARPALYRDGRWWADYRRLRVLAVRE